MQYRFINVFLFGTLFGWVSNSWLVEPMLQTEPINSKRSLTKQKEVEPLPALLTRELPDLAPISESPNVQPTRLTLITKFSQALEAGRLEEADRYLSILLEHDPFHPEVLMATAILALKRNDYQVALDALTELFYQHQTKYKAEVVEQKIRQLAESYLKRPTVTHQNQERQNFLRQIIALLPEHFDFRYQLGLSLVATKAYTEAEQQLNYLELDSRWENEANSLRKAIFRGRQLENGAVEIPIQKTGQGWLVEAQINQQQTIRLLIDTGANITIINETVLPYTDFSGQSIKLHTAGGISTANLITLDQLSIGQVSDNSFNVAVVKEGKLPPGIDGLLGTDWLARFQFMIDQPNRLLRIEAETYL